MNKTDSRRYLSILALLAFLLLSAVNASGEENSVPDAVNDESFTFENTPLSDTVASNDVPSADGGNVWAKVTDSSHGTVVLNPDGSYIYTPSPNYQGYDSFTYNITDTNGDVDTATVTIIVYFYRYVDAVDDTATTTKNTPLSDNVISNDHYDRVFGHNWCIMITWPSHGTVVLNLDGSYIYTPSPNYCGQDSFGYILHSWIHGSDAADVTITVECVNNLPNAFDDAYSTDEDMTLTVDTPGVLVNDTDPDGDTLTVTDYTQPGFGTLTIGESGSFTYAPNADYSGTDSFTYTVSDGEMTDMATASVTVNPINDAPYAFDDAYSTDEDMPLTVDALGLLANDGDVDGDTLSVTDYTQPAQGTVTVDDESGSFTYMPSLNYNGDESFIYEISDGNVGVASATITVTIEPVNDAPVAIDDSVEADENTALDIDVLANDQEQNPDGADEALTITSITQPSNGGATMNGGSINYMPNLWYSGVDSFQYTIADTTDPTTTSTATVTIAIEDTIPSPEDICAFIQSLPNDAFKNDVDNRKTAFCNKLAEISGMIASKQYADASNKLKNDILSKVDSDKPNAGWIIDPVAQDELCSMINTLLDALSVDWLPCV